ncbi:hypothetical protein LUX57_53300 [Actinomadura madurae]|uniref:hypothetical protein n=1 Tax=Actinomadura madurae TaxID=1993 RepID=UPI0020D21373|nr:hypothetical protein [Actinomadura madurae]MCP9972780.1 hypothetical protein [Actinomadura madurae]
MRNVSARFARAALVRVTFDLARSGSFFSLGRRAGFSSRFDSGRSRFSARRHREPGRDEAGVAARLRKTSGAHLLGDAGVHRRGLEGVLHLADGLLPQRAARLRREVRGAAHQRPHQPGPALLQVPDAAAGRPGRAHLLADVQQVVELPRTPSAPGGSPPRPTASAAAAPRSASRAPRRRPPSPPGPGASAFPRTRRAGRRRARRPRWRSPRLVSTRPASR